MVSAQGHICVAEAMNISRSEQGLHGEDAKCHEKDGFDDSGENKCHQCSGDEEKKNVSSNQRERFSLTTG